MSRPPFDYNHHSFGPRTNPKLPLQKGTLDLSAIPPRVAELIPAVDEAARVPFTGITTDGRIVPGLFGIENTSLGSRPRGPNCLAMAGVVAGPATQAGGP